MQTFDDVISMWPTAEEFGAAVGVTALVARQWRRRNSIPASHWRAVVDAAQVRGFESITETALTNLAAKTAANPVTTGEAA